MIFFQSKKGSFVSRLQFYGETNQRTFDRRKNTFRVDLGNISEKTCCSVFSEESQENTDEKVGLRQPIF